MTKGFFDYEGRDDDEPRTYYDSRVAKAKREGTWNEDKTFWSVPNTPKGAMTKTARHSFWQAILHTGLAIGWVYLGVRDWFDDGFPWRAVFGVFYIPFTVLWWRSYRVLKRWEAQPDLPPPLAS